MFNTRSVNLLHSYAAHYLHALYTLQSEYHNLLGAVQTLISGYLPMYFVSPTRLQDVLRHLDAQLRKQGHFKIIHSQVGYYYRVPLITYVRAEDHLYIKLKIPVGPTDTVFSLYPITALPIPISHEANEGLTIIEGNSTYLGISKDTNFYMDLDEKEILHCPCVTIKMPKDAANEAGR